MVVRYHSYSPRQFTYETALIDMQMPEMDGMAATRHIRNENTGALNSGISIIAMTAHAMEKAGKEGNLKKLQALLPRLKDQFVHLGISLK